MKIQKRAMAIHDISGFGKCSLTVALPVISAAGIETSVMPTAVLSTHTGGITGYTWRDLTSDLRPFKDHWKSLGLTFDAIYSGYLGSTEQIGIVSDIIDDFRKGDCFAIVDPAMADNGKMYALFDKSFAASMAKLCGKADIIVPNITEAVFMLGREYKEGPYTKEYIEDLVRALSGLGAEKVVLTGVYFEGSKLGAAYYDRASDTVGYCLADRVEGMYHGTGDIFASALTAALVRGKDLARATEIAVNFTVGSIRRTAAGGTDHRYGVDFERGLGEFIADLEK